MRTSAIEVYAVHHSVARERTTFFCSNVLTALNETVCPDFVLKLTVAGFLTVFVAIDLHVISGP